MTEKNIFAYKLFLSLNILDFNLFFNKHSNPLKKVTLLFWSNLTLKVEVLSSLSFFKIWLEVQPPPLPPFPPSQAEGGRVGAHYELWALFKRGKNYFSQTDGGL